MGADHAESSRGADGQMCMATRLIEFPSRLPKKNATTTKPYSFESVLTNTQKTIAKVDCFEYAAATSTMELYYNTTNASTHISQNRLILQNLF